MDTDKDPRPNLKKQTITEEQIAQRVTFEILEPEKIFTYLSASQYNDFTLPLPAIGYSRSGCMDDFKLKLVGSFLNGRASLGEKYSAVLYDMTSELNDRIFKSLGDNWTIRPVAASEKRLQLSTMVDKLVDLTSPRLPSFEIVRRTNDQGVNFDEIFGKLDVVPAGFVAFEFKPENSKIKNAEQLGEELKNVALIIKSVVDTFHRSTNTLPPEEALLFSQKKNQEYSGNFEEPKKAPATIHEMVEERIRSISDGESPTDAEVVQAELQLLRSELILAQKRVDVALRANSLKLTQKPEET